MSYNFRYFIFRALNNRLDCNEFELLSVENPNGMIEPKIGEIISFNSLRVIQANSNAPNSKYPVTNVVVIVPYFVGEVLTNV